MGPRASGDQLQKHLLLVSTVGTRGCHAGRPWHCLLFYVATGSLGPPDSVVFAVQLGSVVLT